MKQQYTRTELDAILERVRPRTGWDFSRMSATRDPVPWTYEDVVRGRLPDDAVVLDVGTGGGERFLSFADRFHEGLGIDVDPEMIEVARRHARGIRNVAFRIGSSTLSTVPETFDAVLDRHAPFDLAAIAGRLHPGGVFVTQQVGERNMANVGSVLGRPTARAVVSEPDFAEAGLELITFDQYDVRYAVDDVESLVFWLRSLDLLHADLDGGRATADVSVFNAILAGGFEDGRFMTNEHRYLAVARKR